MPILRTIVALVIGFGVAPILPVYVRSSMTRASMESGGDRISYGIKLHTLPGLFAELKYVRPESSRWFYLVLNLAVAFSLALAIAAGVWFGWRYLATRRAQAG